MKWLIQLNILLTVFLSLTIVITVKGQRHNNFSVVIYAIKEDGTLWWYRHKGAADGSENWDGPSQVGTGWQNVLQLFSVKGKIYAVKEDGTLWWYNHKGVVDGSANWDTPRQVGTGWQFKQIFSSNGGIYAIKNDGTLWWYNHKGDADGSFNWDAPKQVGNGWQFKQIFSSGSKIYAVKEDGTLWWYNHKGAADGSFNWGTPSQIGTGWQNFKQLFGARGRIYAIKQDGTLWWYNHKGVADGTFSWDAPKQIGTGWGDFLKVAPFLIDDLAEPAAVVPSSPQQPSAPATLTVFGAIGDKYNKMVAGHEFPGNPVTNEQSTADGKGRYQKFGDCWIYWHPSIGAYSIRGAILKLFTNLGDINTLGYPATDQITCPDHVGKFNHFKKLKTDGTWAESSIYWLPGSGAHEIHGAIREKWKAIGWEKSRLGYPISQETQSGEFRVQRFQKGQIIWSPSKGAIVEESKTY